MKILIVDDSGDDRKLLRYVVENKGHESMEAEDGLEGLRMAKIHTPDLIISDALMPVMDGFQFLKAIKGDEKLRSIPFVFYSAIYKADKDVDLAIALGAEAYILKPKEPADLWNEVEIILQGQKRRKVSTRELITEEEEYLKRYSQVVAAKLEEKIRELEEALAERKRAEEALYRMNRELRAISACNQVLVRAEDEQILLNDICRIICNDAGYRMAWVGYAENDDARTIRPVARAGVEDGYIEEAGFTWADTERGRGQSGTAIRSGQTVCIQDFATEPKAALWRERALQRGYRSSIALPLKDKNANTFGLLIIYSTEPNAFTPDEIRLLGELADDLAFGIVVLRDRAERKKAEEQIRYQAALLANVNDAIVASDENYRLTAWNAAAESLYGWKAEEVLGRSGLEVVQTDYQGADKEEMLRAIAAVGRWRGEATQVRKDGTRIPVEVSSMVLHEENGRIAGYVSVNHDITRRRRGEQERLAHLKFLESLDLVNRAMQGTNDSGRMMSDVLDVVLTIFDCDRASLVYPCDPEAASHQVPMERTRPEYPGALALGCEMPMDPDVVRVFRTVQASSGPVQFGTGSGHPLPAEMAKQFHEQSEIAMAIYPKTGKPWMFVLHQCSYPRIWSPEEERLFQEIGRRLADGLTGLLAYRDLRESENRYRRITEELTDYQYSVRVENGRPAETTHSPACAIVTGYTAQEYAADPYLWIRMVAPEDREQVRERIQQILAGKESPPLDHRITRKDGAVRWVCDTIILLRDAAGQLLSYDGVIKDITERKWAEAELDRVNRRNRLILESAGEGIFGLDSEGKVTFANPVAAVMLGYDQQELIGISSHELIHSHHANGTPNPEGDCPICRAYRDGAIHRATKSVFWRKNGTAFPVECTSTPIIENDTLIGAVATFRDVTEKEEMEKRLGQAQKMEAIGTLAGGIAHDFNNILTPIIIHAEMALEDIPAKKTALRFSLEEVLKAAERARDLVQQILAFSRQTEGKQVVLNVEPIVKEALKLLRASVPATVEIRSHIKAEPWSILADPTQIHQILMNLCTNAAHAMREKGGVLKIDLTNESLDAEAAAGIPGLASGSYLMLSVGDTGHGMTPETMGRIYDPYFTTKAKGEGTGLGLAVVHGIAASLGGAITVESEPGKGSRFRVYFPMVDRKPLPAVQSTGSLPRGTEHILLVDDEQSMVDAMQPMLEHLGYRVTAGISSVEALEVFRADQSSFDLLLTDQTMPGLTGMELAREVLKIKPGIPILLCSGFSDLVDEEKATAAGIRGYIMKPIVMREMAAMIRHALDNR